jgi:hypothetical protein
MVGTLPIFAAAVVAGKPTPSVIVLFARAPAIAARFPAPVFAATEVAFLICAECSSPDGSEAITNRDGGVGGVDVGARRVLRTETISSRICAFGDFHDAEDTAMLCDGRLNSDVVAVPVKSVSDVTVFRTRDQLTSSTPTGRSWYRAQTRRRTAHRGTGGRGRAP